MRGIGKGEEPRWRGVVEPRALRNYVERSRLDSGPLGRGRKLNKASDRPGHSQGTDTHRGWEPRWHTAAQYAPPLGLWRSGSVRARLALGAAPHVRERNHGHATVRTGFTCWSV